MAIAALLLLIFVLTVVRPMAQKQREKALAERLKQTPSALEAALMVEDAMQKTRREGGLMAKLRESYKFWLH